VRYQVPSAGTGASQQVVGPRPMPGQYIKIQNVSAVPVWIADNQASLDASVDNTGTPQYGFVLQPVGQIESSIEILGYQGGLWVRSQAAGGAVEVIASPVC
jgi:hypothetical protein